MGWRKRNGGDEAMRLKLIACKALYREVSLITATCENFVDVTYIRQGLHDTPAKLKEALQAEIDAIDAGDDVHTYKTNYYNREFDAILLGYGLCSNGVQGLCSQKYSLVIPRVHDCITLFLGSREIYDKYFSENGGTFWYNASWIENAGTPSEQTERAMLVDYTRRFGEENAQYILDTELTQNYSRCAYIRWEELPFPHHEKYTEDAAKFYNWEYDCVEGSSSLMRDFINGKWDDEKFLVVPPGQKIAVDYEGCILKAEG